MKRPLCGIPTCGRELLAESIGTFTFTLVFARTGAIIVDRLSQGATTHLGISFVFGVVVSALIYALGRISDAHFNPAVTLGECHLCERTNWESEYGHPR
ncbi:MAG: hypothetical protein HC840_27590 [Leptolyngbyaceae cyanobacterium RM2_2_4]|nr:hypothetical protein [Leptolyngbyaceae cyanobacterium SM1_4_3]NJN01582.1 hypothetical protein [Leptolyngbyaceae cyanobacterium RM1_1_2]NJO11711.1 hypothetical protein [Leptolyngbyaceae cyanobacterium SL_1_1]NJO52537.1 hypothetical protein [Leptolyngbyaceae cyanobacterium RM2_2_4]